VSLCHHFASVVRPYTITKNILLWNHSATWHQMLVEWSVGDPLINSNSVHFGPRTGLPDKMFKGDDQRIILGKLESNWPNSLRGKWLC
jgi:hypothetical protein